MKEAECYLFMHFVPALSSTISIFWLLLSFNGFLCLHAVMMTVLLECIDSSSSSSTCSKGHGMTGNVHVCTSVHGTE